MRTFNIWQPVIPDSAVSAACKHVPSLSQRSPFPIFASARMLYPTSAFPWLPRVSVKFPLQKLLCAKRI
jgi:hypothetical protein